MAGRFQCHHGTSTLEVNALLALLRGELGDVLGVTSTVPDAVSHADDVLADAAGVRVVQVDGCTKCHEHVWGEGNRTRTCPRCGNNRWFMRPTNDSPEHIAIHTHTLRT